MMFFNDQDFHFVRFGEVKTSLNCVIRNERTSGKSINCNVKLPYEYLVSLGPCFGALNLMNKIIFKYLKTSDHGMFTEYIVTT